MIYLQIGLFLLGIGAAFGAIGLWGLACWAGVVRLPTHTPTCGMCGAELGHTEAWYCPWCEPEYAVE